MKLELPLKVSRPGGASWVSSVSPVVIQLLLGGKKEMVPTRQQMCNGMFLRK